jgi:meso-butanediol dehydrogenase/(S,S)-butanediol dehydrogenase/diacetyl reductase
MQKNEFEGQTAFITAAGAGIGKAIALEWAACGGTAIVTDIDADQASLVASQIRELGGKAYGAGLDVGDLDMIAATVDYAAKTAGGLDAVFNVAGINVARNIEEMGEQEWDAVFDTNLKSIYRIAKMTIPLLRQRGGGSIINVASVAGILAESRCGAYSASKGGVLLLTKNMAMDFARDNIRVNAICPGSTRTPRVERYWQKSPTGQSEIAPLCPMQRSAEPEEIARPALFLASGSASYITGAVLVVDGGLSAGLNMPIFNRM